MNNLQSPPGPLALRPLEGFVLGLLASIIIWGIVQAVHPLFRVPKEFDVPNIGTATEEFLKYHREKDRLDRWHVALYLGALGLLAGTFLAGRESFARRSPLPLLVVPLLSAAGGAVGGVLYCRVLQRPPTDLPPDLKHTLLGQCAAGMPLGFGIGFGLGLTTTSIRGAVERSFTGLAAGALAAGTYVVGTSLLLPEANTSSAFPSESLTRLVWFSLLCGVICLVTPLAGKPNTR